jgi:hypothetical protein
MATANVNDRGSLERAYPEDAFASDAAQNDQAKAEVFHGVHIGSAPDEDGNFELQRATRHVGEPPSADYLTPVRRTEPLDQARNNGPAQWSPPESAHAYAQFLDDIVSAAQHFGYRADESPGPATRGYAACGSRN